jgi:hypothetical protein
VNVRRPYSASSGACAHQFAPIAPDFSQKLPVEQFGVRNAPVVLQYDPVVPLGIAHVPIDDQK